MDDVVNRFAKELADAIAAAVAENMGRAFARRLDNCQSIAAVLADLEILRCEVNK